MDWCQQGIGQPFVFLLKSTRIQTRASPVSLIAVDCFRQSFHGKITVAAMSARIVIGHRPPENDFGRQGVH
jgi:hypothetical protein